MCCFITLIVPTENADAVRAVMKRNGRAASPIDNPSIRKVLHDGEHQYLTTSGYCDCGTALDPLHETPEVLEERLAKEAQKMKRKGWSATKIARAIEDRRKTDSRPDGGGSDSLELWNAVLHQLGGELKLPYAGLFVRFYSGSVATEMFNASRRQVPVAEQWQVALGSMVHNEVTIFPLT